MSVRFACGVVVAATSFDVEDCGTKVSACKIGRRAVVERLKWWCGERGVLSVKICQHCFGENTGQNVRKRANRQNTTVALSTSRGLLSYNVPTLTNDMRRRTSADVITALGNSKSPPMGHGDGCDGDGCGGDVDVPSISDVGVQAGSNTIQSPFASDVDMERYRQCRARIISVYILQLAIVLVVLISGIVSNGGSRKYIPVDPKGLSSLLQTNKDPDVDVKCLRAYVNVHSSSFTKEYSTICCRKDDTFSGDQWGRYQSNLCFPRDPLLGVSTQRFPFAKRLTRFPEAWLLPLLPILIRLVYQAAMASWSFSRTYMKKSRYQRLQSADSSSSSLVARTSSVPLDKIVVASPSAPTPSTQKPISNHKHIQTTIQRLVFYFLLLNFRGWGLYIGANAIEDYVIVPWFTGNHVISPLRTDSTSDIEHNLQYSKQECWYKDVLKAHHQASAENDYYSNCYGQPFDFSDHIVLFLAHYLPIIIMEMMFCWLFPFWRSASSTEKGVKHYQTTLSSVCIALYTILFLYLHAILLYATYQTVVYFHTPGEILVGFGVSGILQLPLGWLMCSERWVRIRRFVGLPTSVSVTGKAD